MMKTKLLKPRMPYLWELLIGEKEPKPMREAYAGLKEWLDTIRPETKVRIYIRIEKD